LVGAIFFGFVREWSGSYYLPFAIGQQRRTNLWELIYCKNLGQVYD